MSSANSLAVQKTIKLFIGGEFPRTESGRSFTVAGHNICHASRKDFRNAVVAAHSALKGWEQRAAYNRSQILYRMAEMAEGKREGLGSEADAIIDAFVYYAGFADKYQQLIGAVNPVSGPHHCFTSSEPVGVVGLLFDEETKASAIVAEISAIIASGNTIVTLLPECLSPLLAPLAEIFATSDLPKGVINLLTGKQDELAPHFATHLELQCLSYQGDKTKGSKLLGEFKTAAAENMKRVVEQSNEPLALETLLNYVEYKTVWHPIGY